MYVCMYVCMLYVFMYVCVYVCMNVCVCVCERVCVNVCVQCGVGLDSNASRACTIASASPPRSPHPTHPCLTCESLPPFLPPALPPPHDDLIILPITRPPSPTCMAGPHLISRVCRLEVTVR
jgi:hypothetical protein